jgi:D-apionolactonase
VSAFDLTAYERMYGRDVPPSELRMVRAGPFECALDGPDLRYLRHGDVELVRRVYLAVRDVNWNTIADSERQIDVQESADGFVATCRLRHKRGPIDFEWNGRIEGQSDGTVVFELDGVCHGAFDYAKIGLCVHHPSREDQGRPYRADTPGGPIEGTLPAEIGPQIYLPAERYDLPLFDPYSSLEILLARGMTVRFDFEGDLFEIEDQRNWTDASYKTASTPAYLGYLHHAEPGTRIFQRITMRCTPVPARPASRAAEPVLTLGCPTGRRLPPIGFGLPSDGQPHSPIELAHVRKLAPDHLRADVRLGDEAALAAALAACQAAGSPLELALFVPSGGEAGLPALGSALAGSGVAVARVLLFRDGAATTDAALVVAARAQLAPQLPGVPLLGGTNVYFCDVNRDRPDMRELDGLVYSVNPQIHAFDERSLAEALDGQADTVLSALSVFGGLPVSISPITLRPRFNAVAVADDIAAAEPELPWEVDPRQMSQFCAAWALGSVKALAEAGAATLTYFETAGWRGLFERDGGSPMPSLYPSQPGMAFPVLGTFSALRALAGAEILWLDSSHPLDVVGLALRAEHGPRVLLANLSHSARTVLIEPAGLRVHLEPFAVESAEPQTPARREPDVGV